MYFLTFFHSKAIKWKNKTIKSCMRAVTSKNRTEMQIVEKRNRSHIYCPSHTGRELSCKEY